MDIQLRFLCVESNATFKICLSFSSGKEARKKELKKNKRQRQMVRAAVLKGKDPLQIIAEMEKIDQMGKFHLQNILYSLCISNIV